MAEPRGSIIVTCALCVAFVGLNEFVLRTHYSFFSWLEYWPVEALLGVVIASRIFRGHSTL